MSITRAHVSGALRLLNANNIPNRRGHLQNMLKAEHTQKDVDKALSDLASYPEWSMRADLDAMASGDQTAVATASGAVKKVKRAPVK